MKFTFLSKNQKFKEKVFCIGMNKTGTTSVGVALQDLGYKLGSQQKAQGLLTTYEKRAFDKIVSFCKTADAFQDAPFSYYYTYIVLDQYFPNSKYVLTVRNSDEIWYESLVKFHTKLFSKNKLPPTVSDLKYAKRPNGRDVWSNMKMRFGIESTDPYNKDKLIKYYNTHNHFARDYFRFKSNFLELNLSDKEAYAEFCFFLDKKPVYESFPWKNATKSVSKNH